MHDGNPEIVVAIEKLGANPQHVTFALSFEPQARAQASMDEKIVPGLRELPELAEKIHMLLWDLEQELTPHSRKRRAVTLQLTRDAIACKSSATTDRSPGFKCVWRCDECLHEPLVIAPEADSHSVRTSARGKPVDNTCRSGATVDVVTQEHLMGMSGIQDCL